MGNARDSNCRVPESESVNKLGERGNFASIRRDKQSRRGD